MNIILLLLCMAGLVYTADSHKKSTAATGTKLPVDAPQMDFGAGGSELAHENSGDSVFQVPEKLNTDAEELPEDIDQAQPSSNGDVNNTADDAAEAPNEKKKIRVLIKTQDFAGEYHKAITLVCNSNTKSADGLHSFQAGETLSVDPASNLFDGEGCLSLIPEDEQAGFTVTSFSRAQGEPTYEGRMEIYRSGEGLLLINVLDLESYLRVVVPSEMPASYETEALKAQAVCARTYAWKQMQEGALAKFHADVDDSVSFQVYNNIARQPTTDAAVEATAGQIMMCDGEPITAYFFSTSSGSTSTNEVWAEEPEKYLQCVNSGNLESSEPWFRWSVTLPVSYLNERIAKYGIGSLQAIMVLKKSGGGAVEELKLVGTDGERIISSEYKIRQLFSTKGIPVTRQDGTVVKDMNLMPSAYFTCTPVYEDGQVSGYQFDGGGYGHGVGMSQNGANQLAMQGKNWQEILYYFYAEIDLYGIL